MRKASKTALMAELALKVIEREPPQRMKAKVEIDPFYNPNKDKKYEGNKRLQELRDGMAPPPKRVQMSKVKPNWGGPDPNKLQQQQLQQQPESGIPVNDGAGDGCLGSTIKTSPKKSPLKMVSKLDCISF